MRRGRGRAGRRGWIVWWGVWLGINLILGSAAYATPPVKSVILMIPDGMSGGGVTLARWYQGCDPLAIDEMACGLVRTYSSDAPIADSAPAATAYATGFKSHTGFVGVLPDEATMPGLDPISPSERRRPVATVLEAAKLAGKSTGLVVTCEVPHATPAGFSAHYPDRNNYDVLLEQQVYQGMDVVLGGGAKYLTSEVRKDKEDLVSELKRLGYEYVTTPAQLERSSGSKIWGAFAPKDLAYDFDRDPEREPSLAQMTKKAIEVLSQNPKGFFLMVEGSKIDWASHANDPIGVISDILAFDKAVRVALDFAKRSQDTVVIVATDHGNGGITIGDRGSSKNYDKLTLEEIIAPLKKAKLTGEGVEKKLNADQSNIREVMANYYGLDDLSDEEIAAIRDAKEGSLNYVVGPMISKRAHIGWTTNGHTGEDVTLYVYSPTEERPSGLVENTEIARYIERILDLNLRDTTEKIFVAASPQFRSAGASVRLDESNPANPVLVVEKDNVVGRFPVNKNIIEVNGQKIPLRSITVYNGQEVFVPSDGVSLLMQTW